MLTPQNGKRSFALLPTSDSDTLGQISTPELSWQMRQINSCNHKGRGAVISNHSEGPFSQNPGVFPTHTNTQSSNERKMWQTTLLIVTEGAGACSDSVLVRAWIKVRHKSYGINRSSSAALTGSHGKDKLCLQLRLSINYYVNLVLHDPPSQHGEAAVVCLNLARLILTQRFQTLAVIQGAAWTWKWHLNKWM